MIPAVIPGSDAAIAFAKFVDSRKDHGLPWEIAEDDLRDVFMSGWQAHIEAGKQVEMFASAPAVTLLPMSAPPITTVQQAMEVLNRATAMDVYTAYPRKVGKLSALKAITKAAATIQDGDHGGMECLLQKTKAFAAAVAKWPPSDKRFIPHPATWYNRGSYDDDPAEWQRGGAAAVRPGFSKSYNAKDQTP